MPIIQGVSFKLAVGILKTVREEIENRLNGKKNVASCQGLLRSVSRMAIFATVPEIF